MRWLKRVLLFAGGGLVVLAIVVAILPKPVPVEVAEVERRDFEVTVDEDGRTRVKDRYVVSAPLAGNLDRVRLEPGDAVKQGQVIARIVPLEAPLLDVRAKEGAQARVAAARAAQLQARAQVDRARAALEFARRELARSRELVEHGAISRQVLDQSELEERTRAAELASAQFAAKVADYELRVAEAALSRHAGGAAPAAVSTDQLEVTSPVDGKILRVMQESEGAVQAGAPILEVGDPRALEIASDVLTSDAVSIEPGAPALIEQWGGPPLEGQVRLIEPSAFTKISALGVEEQRVNVVIDLLDPYDKWAALGDGYRVETRITTWRADDVVTVPSSALFRRGDAWAVFVVEDEHAVRRQVEVGRRNGLAAQVLRGLEPGERVIVHPSDRLSDGTEVALR